MYYIQIGVTILIVIGVAISLVYTIILSIKTATGLMANRNAMKRAFVVTFYMWMSMFLLYFMWTDKKGWGVTTITLGFVSSLIISIVLASFSAFGLWNWRR
jgi:hypothetical protein